MIAEVAQAHDGSLGMAHAFIDAAADAGAAAVKFQTHLAAAESTPEEPWRVKFSVQDATRYDYWKRMEFTEEQWRGLAEHCRRRGVTFMSTPFSIPAAELLERVGVPVWKVGSAEVTCLPLIEWLARTGKPVILSSGMCRWEELDAAVAAVRGAGTAVAVMQCTSRYPTPPEMVGLNVLAQLKERYQCPVGLSDHSGTMWAGLAAAALGASLVEVHITFSRRAFGPDVPASVTIEELEQLVAGVRFIAAALRSPVDKDRAAAELEAVRQTFGRSVVAARDLEAGAVVTEADLAFKKPAGGLPAGDWRRYVGRRLLRAVRRDERFREDDFD